MLKIGLTGGIAAGKSVVAQRFRELGAVLIDADVLAREVVQPGSEGLGRITDAFGPGILLADGSLDRPALGDLVFGNEAERGRLNAIVHPLVRAEAARIMDSAAQDAIVVQDIPLLVETGQGAKFHLVVVVDAPEELRIRRMTSARGLSTADAVGRIQAQASAEQRLAAADVVIDNTGELQTTIEQVDRLWYQRLVDFSENLEHHRVARPDGAPTVSPHDPSWPDQARRLRARIKAAAPEEILAVDHVGPTAVPGQDAEDVIELQVTVPSLEVADRIADRLDSAGFPPVPGIRQERLHGNADPGRPVKVRIRPLGPAAAKRTDSDLDRE